MGRKPPNRERDYDVGYGKPPQHTQFRPGHSGRKPRKASPERSLEEILHDRLKRQMVVKRGGREERISTKEALIEKLVQSALTGNVSSMRQIFSLKDNPQPKSKPAAIEPQPGSRIVHFEILEEELPLIKEIQDELNNYFVPAPTAEPRNRRDEEH